VGRGRNPGAETQTDFPLVLQCVVSSVTCRISLREGQGLKWHSVSNLVGLAASLFEIHVSFHPTPFCDVIFFWGVVRLDPA
jgi:hypothetical protein